MRIDGHELRSLQLDDDGLGIVIIDQTKLPHELAMRRLETPQEAARAIADMQVRGAPLIGVTAAYGIALAMMQDSSDAMLAEASQLLAGARPTAVNLMWAVDEMRRLLEPLAPAERQEAAYAAAAAICEEDSAMNAAIGQHGLKLLRAIAAKKPPGAALNILTHCNAGWLATADWGTATAPIYMAHEAGMNLHVYVSETRPRNQGASLTAWEMDKLGVPHSLIVDNAAGHLMQRGEIDVVLVGTDRTTARGDVCNKIGTYLKALAASDNGVPFYVGCPSPSIDFSIEDGKQIEIEGRSETEVTHVSGLNGSGRAQAVRVAPARTRAVNPGFDVTPARLVTGLITERGIVRAERYALAHIFPEQVMEASKTANSRKQPGRLPDPAGLSQT